MPLIAFVIAVVAVVSCVFTHLATMVALSRTLDRWFKRAHWWAIGCMVLIAIQAHILEISVFAVGIRLLRYLHNGEIWQENERFFEPWYQSAVAYTTLGDETPNHASVRLLVSVEALTGLILIAWTASFLFLVMQRTWDDERINWRDRPRRHSKPTALEDFEVVESGNFVG